ncbi:glycoside hydrolase family 32 protein [Bacillus tianshenii]|nr:glycoside hydrolase family 32 protein [Bacillus tianshenii]
MKKQTIILLAISSVLIMAVVLYQLINSKSEEKAKPNQKEEKVQVIPADYNQSSRPQFHYTPRKNWMNDPNGMVYYKGKYHLFYQHNPKGNEFGNMSWGHAVSEDLVHWKEQPVALKPDEHGMIFSGSVVVDKKNASGLFPEEGEGLIAFYTSAGDTQDQRIAYSTDEGKTWKKHEGNPVIPNPGIKDFRDPKVVWHEESKQWVMLLAAGKKIMFYGSKNLVDWNYLSEFGEGKGAQGGVWETPELFHLPVDGNENDKKWILQVDMNPGSVAGGSGGQYFIGEFNGKEFISEQENDEINWVDYGKDFYAAQSFNNKEGNPIWLAWMSNWQYAADLPVQPWKGAMSIPREVSLKDTNGKVQLVQQPVEEMKKLRGELVYETKNKQLNEKMPMSDFNEETYEIVAEFELGDAKEFGFRIHQGKSEETIVGYDNRNQLIFTDRVRSGKTDFHPEFAGVYRAPAPPMEGNTVKLHLYVDRSSVELFANNGQKVMTNRIFPSDKSNGLEIYALEGSVKIKSLQIYKMKSMWKK